MRNATSCCLDTSAVYYAFITRVTFRNATRQFTASTCALVIAEGIHGSTMLFVLGEGIR
jgi:hypothetical protein